MSVAFRPSTRPVTSYDQIIDRIDGVIADSRRNASRVGYFAGLYRKVALAFKAGIEGGTFQRPDLIGRLDVIFFNRYLDALDRFERGLAVPGPWRVALQSAAASQPTVLQHLLLGCNAHMNFDLALSVAESCPIDQLPALEPDFTTMNRVLSGLLDDVRGDLERVWPGLGLLDRIAGEAEDRIIGFSMEKARAFGWALAGELARAGEAERRSRVAAAEVVAVTLGTMLARPPAPLDATLAIVRAGERGSVAEIIDVLAA
jgi:hypothetical protein